VTLILLFNLSCFSILPYFLNIYSICIISILLNSSVDINEYVLKETKDWCIAQLSMYKIDLSTLSSSNTILGGARVHVQAYHCLRNIVQQHIESGVAPFLSKSLKPTSGYHAVKAQGGVLSTLL
jgi:hypothetical protein